MPVKFRKVWVSDDRYESAAAIDVNQDGVLDIVSGAWWYEGPDFRKKHFIGEVMQSGEYYDDFSTIPLDVNGNGRLDFLTGGWWGGKLIWKENSGEANNFENWQEHMVAEIGNIESVRAYDIDGDGIPEIIPNTPGQPLIIYKLITDAAGKGTSEFSATTIYSEAQGHGLGFGDISGNGRVDIILTKGWLEAPEDPYKGEWILHEDSAFDFWDASVPILVADVTGNGLNDIIVGSAHNYGLYWYEQCRDENGVRSWKKHPIDPFYSQYHDMQWVDIDGDGECELLTGKRHRAHCGNDPGEFDDMAICYFKWNGESFTKCIIDFSRIEQGTCGLGIFFGVADLRGTGRLDIIAPGKAGLYIYYNEGNC